MDETPKQPTSRRGKRIDWDRLRARLAAARAGVERELAPEEKAGILRKRAAALAEPPPRVREAAADLEVLEFLLTYERYAIELCWIAETYPLKDITPLPGTPLFLAGIVNVRGRVLSVIDIRRFFDLPEKGLTNLNRVIILSNGEMEFGLLADEILGTRSIPQAEAQPGLPTLTGIRQEYLKGVTRDRTTILDGAKLLNDRSLVVHEEIGD